MKQAVKLIVVGFTSLIFVSEPVQAGIITQVSSRALSNQLAGSFFNFHPQGLGYDPSANELLFMQQSLQRIFRTDLSGNIVGTQAINQSHTVSVAADADFYYYSDYTSNSSGLDMFRVNKIGGAESPFSSERVAYGGYPIDVRNGLLYRTEPSTVYNYRNLDQVRVSSVATPNTISQVLNLAGGAGIGDIAVDANLGNLWTLDYSATAAIRRYNLATGALLDSFNLSLDGRTAGLTVTNDGRLFYYDWNLGSGSTLTEYSFSGSAVPEPSSLLLFGIGACCLCVSAIRHRREKTQNTTT